MHLWISGGMQQALLKDSDIYYLLSIEIEAEVASIAQKDLYNLTKDWQDVYSKEVSSEEDAFAELRRAALCYDSLLASSLAIDSGVKFSRRERSAIETEHMFENKFAKDYVMNIYCAYPMPDSADLISTKVICEDKDLAEFYNLIETIEEFSSQISAARKSWERIDDSVFESPLQRSAAQAEIIRAGLFLDMVKRIDNEKRCEIFLALLDKPENAYLRKLQTVLAIWQNEAKRYSIKPQAPIALFNKKQSTETSQLSFESKSLVQLPTGAKRNDPAFARA